MEIDVKGLLGATFKGTVITEEGIYPWMIVHFEENGYAVSKVQSTARGERVSHLGYYSTFESSIRSLNKKLLQDKLSAKVVSFEEYLAEWKRVADFVSEKLTIKEF